MYVCMYELYVCLFELYVCIYACSYSLPQLADCNILHPVPMQQLSCPVFLLLLRGFSPSFSASLADHEPVTTLVMELLLCMQRMAIIGKGR